MIASKKILLIFHLYGFIQIFLFAIIFKVLGIKKQIDFDTFGHFYYAKCLREQAKGFYGFITTNVSTQKPEKHFSNAMLWNWCLSKLGDPVKLLR